MLASLIGVDEDEAAERLDCTVLMTVATDAVSQTWAAEIQALLERTVNVVLKPNSDACAVELIVGQTAPRTSATRVYAAIDAERAVIDLAPTRRDENAPHPLFGAIAASPAAAAVLFKAIDAQGLPVVRFPVTIRFDQLGLSTEALRARIDVDGAVLVGAGAVGNAFLRALRLVDAHGKLPIVDPKIVGGGNPNRCLYLTADDVKANKAEALARNAQPDFPNVELLPFVGEFGKYVELNGVQRTAIVTVDSRRVRRSIQSEVPGRVLDASTTDIRSVVVHSHQQPTVDACLACIYRHVPDENARERAIADGLGIELDMVKESLISAAAAAKICAVHPKILASKIEGMAYDSLFKQLCAEKALKTPEGRQVLAPFAFVSSLAGALLVVEMLRSDAGAAQTNYWQVDPWGEPRGRLRVRRPRVPDCEFCSKPYALSIVNELWGKKPSMEKMLSLIHISEPTRPY